MRVRVGVRVRVKVRVRVRVRAEVRLRVTTRLPPPSAASRGCSREARQKWPRWLMPTVASKPSRVRSGASACK